MSTVAPRAHPRRFGAYVLGRRIGSGGMATVFAARQMGIGAATRVVAVKVMATALADDPAARRMFEREAVIATRVEHPNIVRTYEVGEVKGEIFLAMELVPGAALSRICAAASGSVPLAIAIRIVSDVARGLSAVHDLREPSGELLGVVHQDVTPHNVLVGYNGTTKLLDFGVARMAAFDGSRTESIRGKPAYLAPEQLFLERIDQRTDIFGLGAVFFELLTGARSSAQGPSRPDLPLERRPAVDVRTLRSDVPEAIAKVVAKALALDPDARFSSAEEMRRALAAARDASGLAIVEENEVGAWVGSVAEPAWSLPDLERELALEDSYHSELAAVSDLPTIPEGPASSRARTSPQARRVRRSLGLGAACIVLGAAGVGAIGYARQAKQRAAPGLRMASYAAGEEVPGAGVHLVVTQSSPDSGAWAHVAFDHITVTATSGSRDVVVCLTPRAEGQRAFVVPSPSRTDPDPCADLHGGAYAGVNGVYPPATINDDWDLIPNPWELDFDGISPLDTVSVRAKAVFGGAAAVAAPRAILIAEGTAVARTPFAKVSLPLSAAPGGAFWGEGENHCAMGDAISSWLDRATFTSQGKNAVACPRAAKSLAYTEALRTVATPTMGVVGRIPAVAKSGCSSGEPDGVIVWKSDLVPVEARCISFLFTGRFAKCASGASSDPNDPAGCTTSVRCVPPPTDLVAIAADGRVLKTENISCVPSYPEPIQYALTLTDTSASAVALALRRGASAANHDGDAGDESGCFFDIYDFSAQPGCTP
jgi:serine/threonine protein kinase